MRFVMKYLRLYVDSVFAGLMIAIGTTIYLNCPNRVAGAILFSVGLITIMTFGLKLYTGVIGFVRDLTSLLDAVICFLGNGVGCVYIALIPTSGATEVWEAKLQTPLFTAFLKGVICGIIIFLCVAQHKAWGAPTSTITTLVAIPAFILCGAEHSIADICFMFAARNISTKGIILILVVAIGNAVGSLALSLWVSIRDEIK